MEKPLTYNKINLQKRKQLVDMVIVQKISIANAGRMLQIKNSTAKLIVKKYKETGTFFQPKRQLNPDNLTSENIAETTPATQNQTPPTVNEQIVPNTMAQTPYFFYYSQEPDYFWSTCGQNYYQNPITFMYF